MFSFKSPLHSLRKKKYFQSLLKSKWNRPIKCNLGLPFKVALRPFTHASILLKPKSLEPEIQILIRDIIAFLEKAQDKGHFYDIGANVGWYSWLVRSITKKREILAFEPDPLNLELLAMTQAHAQLKNFKIESVALSNHAGNKVFFQDSITSATGSIESDGKPWIERYLGLTSKQINVQTCLMDHYLTEHRRPSLIKIDVEGHELAVLNGGFETLRHKPLLVIESFPPRQYKVARLLDDLGYELTDADRRKPIGEKTTNLFAWHPDGPLSRNIIQRILHS